MKLLITGGAGFIGSSFIPMALDRGHRVVNLDLLTYSGSHQNMSAFAAHDGYRFQQADIRDRSEVNKIIRSDLFDALINFAAESHVDRSISAPEKFASTNVLGTVTLLEAARQFGIKTFIQISTDEVYGSLKAGSATTESALAPSSPYSASKAAADHFVGAFHTTYGLDTRITRCTNNYGPRQHSEKFIPTVIRCALGGLPIPIYGSGENLRDWIFVEDHCRGILEVLTRGSAGEVYHFGANCELSNNELAKRILAEMENLGVGRNLFQLLSFVDDRPGHDFRYALDCKSTQESLGWLSLTDMSAGLRETINWYLKNPTFLATLPTNA